jgi:hypothetical protein
MRRPRGHRLSPQGSKEIGTPVTVITDAGSRIGDTPDVVMVRGAPKQDPFEPGGARQPWKGEAAARFVSTGITSSRALPTSSAGYWSPKYLRSCKRLRSDVFLGRRFFVPSASEATESEQSISTQMRSSPAAWDVGGRFLPVQWVASQPILKRILLELKLAVCHDHADAFVGEESR